MVIGIVRLSNGTVGVYESRKPNQAKTIAAGYSAQMHSFANNVEKTLKEWGWESEEASPELHRYSEV